MRFTAGHIMVAVTLSLGCAEEPWPRPAAMPPDRFAAEFETWRENRRSRLVVPGSGPVSWVGLWELYAGDTPIGSDSALPIVLSGTHSPHRAGTLRRSGDSVRFEPAAGAGIQLADGTTVNGPLVLASDRTDFPTVLALGSLRLQLHGEPGTDRLWLRAWDQQHPDRTTFRLPESFALDPAWRVSARLERFKAPRIYRVADITGGSQEYRSPGELIFRVDGREHRLVAFADSTSKDFFMMFWDSTATTTSYKGGRYLRAPLPAADGWTVIDFNRAYNPPCVFTPYSTCALPPRENRLALAVAAGEKRADSR